MSKNSTAQVVRDPAMSTPEFYNYLIQTIKQTATLQPVNECKEVHSVIFLSGGTQPILSASNALTVPFAVKRVKYSIIARQSDNAHDTPELFLLSSSLTSTHIGCISNDHNDLTDIQFGEFIYQQPRNFNNERLTIEIMEGLPARLNPIGFHGTIVLILELSNY